MKFILSLTLILMAQFASADVKIKGEAKVIGPVSNFKSVELSFLMNPNSSSSISICKGKENDRILLSTLSQALSYRYTVEVEIIGPSKDSGCIEDASILFGK